MKQHHTTHLRFSLLCLFSLFLFSDVVAQKSGLVPLDSLITVGYATGSLKTISGSVEKITETQMNKDQITNPLEAIRGRVPGLTIQRGTNGPAALDAVRLRGTTADYRRWSLRRFEYAYLHLSYRHRELHHPERRFRNGTVRITRRLRCHRNHHQEGHER